MKDLTEVVFCKASCLFVVSMLRLWLSTAALFIMYLPLFESVRYILHFETDKLYKYLINYRATM